MDRLIIYLASFIVVILVLPVHEFAHAFAAVKCGDPTPKIEGRYTINPIKHFDPLGLLMLVLVHFGWAKPVPVNPYNFRHLRRDYFFVSVAGITANIIMAFIFALLFVVFCNVVNDINELTSRGAYLGLKLVYYVLYYGIMINVNLFAFNLIPVFPLDGFRILDCLTLRRGKVFNFLRAYGRYILLGLLAWSFVCDFLKESFHLFYYLDILGMALGFIDNLFFRVFTGFWGLFF